MGRTENDDEGRNRLVEKGEGLLFFVVAWQKLRWLGNFKRNRAKSGTSYVTVSLLSLVNFRRCWAL
jgi:hypothetical protein